MSSGSGTKKMKIYPNTVGDRPCIYDIDGVILDTYRSALRYFKIKESRLVDYYDSSAYDIIMRYLDTPKDMHNCESIIDENIGFLRRSNIAAFVTARPQRHISYLLRHPDPLVRKTFALAPLICTGGDKFSVLKHFGSIDAYYFDDNYNNCLSARACGLHAVHIRAPGVKPLEIWENQVDSYDSLAQFEGDFLTHNES